MQSIQTISYFAQHSCHSTAAIPRCRRVLRPWLANYQCSLCSLSRLFYPPRDTHPHLRLAHHSQSDTRVMVTGGAGTYSTRLDSTDDACVQAMASRSDRKSVSLDRDQSQEQRRPLGSGDDASRPSGARGCNLGRRLHAALRLRRRTHRPRAVSRA